MELIKKNCSLSLQNEMKFDSLSFAQKKLASQFGCILSVMVFASRKTSSILIRNFNELQN